MSRRILTEQCHVSFMLHFSQKTCAIRMECCLPLFANCVEIPTLPINGDRRLAKSAKRSHLMLPQERFEVVQRIAGERHSTVIGVLYHSRGA